MFVLSISSESTEAIEAVKTVLESNDYKCAAIYFDNENEIRLDFDNENSQVEDQSDVEQIQEKIETAVYNLGRKPNTAELSPQLVFSIDEDDR